MLTSELLRVRRAGDRIEPRYLGDKERLRLAPVVRAMTDVLARSHGARREDLERALDAIEHRPGDRVIVQGLRKLLLDRCELACPPGPDPATLREEVFRRAAEVRRELGPRDSFGRDSVIAAAAETLELAPSSLEGLLFADLRQNETLAAFRTIDEAAVLDRYDVALAQGALLRATEVLVALDGEEPGRVRQLFRAARFHGLLHRVERHGDGGYLVTLDGPFSLFSAVQKYGLKLAMFLPSVLRCRRWRLRARLCWGKSREPAWFELGPEQGLVASGDLSPGMGPSGVAPEIERFIEGFRKLGSSWIVERNDEIIALPGEAVCVPDLTFRSAVTGEEVYLEAFGFWSRQAVWRRIETLQRGFPSRIILAVGKQLRVSEEALGEAEVGQLYVYQASMRPRAVLERLDDPSVG